MTKQAKILVDAGWKPVAGSWLSPVTFGMPLYFDLQTAYELEVNGVGAWAYAAEEALAEQLRAKDIAIGEAQEAEYFAEHGVHRGVPPNY